MTDFEKKALKVAGVVVLCMISYLIGIYSVNHRKYDLYKAYEQYYTATESTLDSLDNKYDWVDSYDPANYYKALSNLKEVKTKLHLKAK